MEFLIEVPTTRRAVRTVAEAEGERPLRQVAYLTYEVPLYSGKRVLDLLIAGPAILLAFPILVLTAIWILATSGGPALHRQTRLGLRGRPFVLWKMRTMQADCEAETGPRWALPNDPAILPGGRFLRRWHIDELPQLLNVLRGEMSLIGPRPERPEIHRRLESEIPDITQRLAVRPGLTGLAQVTLPSDRCVIGFRRKTELDLWYIREAGFSFDLRILFWTFLKVMGLRNGWVYPRRAEA